MDNTRKIVLVVFAIYVVLGLQFFFVNGSLILPVDFNPLVLLLVAILSAVSSFKNISFRTNVVYLTGLSIYAFLSERTLNIVYNYLELDWAPILIDNPFIRLIQICGFLVMVIALIIKYSVKNKVGLLPLVLVVSSCCFGLANSQLAYVVLFSLFALSFVFINLFSSIDALRIKFSGISYQLLLFVLLENAFTFLH